MLDRSKVILEAGRTPKRGNYVSAIYNGFEVCLFDDRGKESISQIGLKEMCLKQLEIVFSNKN